MSADSSPLDWMGPGGGGPFRYRLVDGCEVEADTTEFDWLERRVPFWGRGSTLRQVIPSGFDAYARVLHPARDAGGEPVRWASVARATGRILHAEVQWEALLRGPRGAAPSELISPWKSRTGGDVAETLRRLLLGEGEGAAYCVALWSGLAGLSESFPEAARLSTGFREFMLFRIRADVVVGDMLAPSLGRVPPGLWWPHDRSWCVAKEVDFCWTYVGGSRDLIDRVLAHPDLEALEVGPEHRGDYTSDTINGPVTPRYR